VGKDSFFTLIPAFNYQGFGRLKRPVYRHLALFYLIIFLISVFVRETGRRQPG
jgi:hypothetical protein